VHPAYLVDFISQVQDSLRTDSAIIDEQVKALSKTEIAKGKTFTGNDILWYLSDAARCFHSLQHTLTQLSKQVEKLEDNASKQI